MHLKARTKLVRLCMGAKRDGYEAPQLAAFDWSAMFCLKKHGGVHESFPADADSHACDEKLNAGMEALLCAANAAAVTEPEAPPKVAKPTLPKQLLQEICAAIRRLTQKQCLALVLPIIKEVQGTNPVISAARRLKDHKQFGKVAQNGFRSMCDDYSQHFTLTKKAYRRRLFLMDQLAHCRSPEFRQQIGQCVSNEGLNATQLSILAGCVWSWLHDAWSALQSSLLHDLSVPQLPVK